MDTGKEGPTVTTAPPEPKLPFTRLGEYEIIAPIAEGGMATVWLGRSTEPSGRLVALKVIRPEHVRSKEFVAMFRDEAQIATRLSHPNIISIHGLGHDGRQHFLAMEVLRGRTLLDLWRATHDRGERLPYEVVAWIGARIADGLDYAHEVADEKGAPCNIVHRDVNPANVFVTREGVPKLIDFGLAKARDRITSTAVGVVKGKLAYLSPEQTHGKPADRRADVFALGVTLWEVSLNRRLFREDDDVETIRRVREADVPNPSSVDESYPPGLASVLARALARDPADRWQTAGAMRDALDGFLVDFGRPVDATLMAGVLTDLGSGATSSTWEQYVEDAATGSERIRVWDDERQKLTWMHASVEPAETDRVDTVRGEVIRGDTQPSPVYPPVPATRREQLDTALADRIARLHPADGAAVARALLERSLVDEVLGDASQAAELARASLSAGPTSIAHETLRRLERSLDASPRLLEHLDAEIADCTSDNARADLLAERARLLAASGQPAAVVREAWSRVLALRPHHAAAIVGMQVALVGDAQVREDLAAHLGRMAEAYVDEPRLAAWLLVERARVLDRELGQVDAAKAALEQAIALDGGVGPVREACVAHATVHRDAAWLVALLVQGASVEPDSTRAAAMELEAASVARYRLGDPERAVGLLDRMQERPLPDSSLRRHALDELVTLHHAASRPREALRARRLRLHALSEPRVRAHELRTIAALEESLGDRPAAIAALEEALSLVVDDPEACETLDRLFETESLTERRIDLWVRCAARVEEPRVRARRLIRAARLAEASKQPARAAELLRAAIVAHPADEEAVDHLLRILTPPPSTATQAEARARIAVHAHAAEHATDDARRLAHLERVALLEEDVMGDWHRALAVYETMQRLDPSRRVALLGIARTAARTGDLKKLARALLDEAEASGAGDAGDALRVRAAEALVAVDPEQALVVVQEVLRRAPSHEQARRLEQRTHEAAGRWQRVETALATRIEQTQDIKARVELMLARAEMQSLRLRAPREAIATLQAARELDPTHPAVRAATVAQLEAVGDARALRDGLVELASSESAGADRARTLARAAEIDEHVLLDDGGALDLWARAATEDPGATWLVERRLRLLARWTRTHGPDDLRAALHEQLERHPSDPAATFALARALFDEPDDLSKATSLLEVVLERDPAAAHALYALEQTARRTASSSLCSKALALQAEAFVANTPKLGALWAEAALLEWSGDPTETIARILRRARTDRAALEAGVRLALPKARSGDAEARTLLREALTSRLEQASGVAESLYLQLALALTLDPEQPRRDAPDVRAALGHYHEALRLDPQSVVAAYGLARLAAIVGDAEALVAATVAQADLASQHRRRGVLLVQAASQVLGAESAAFGDRPARLARAGELLEQALDTDPEALPPLGLLVAVRTEEKARDRLLATLRSAFERAKSTQAVVQLGSEIARVASLDPPDRLLAIDALRRVRSIAPGDGATARSLADQYLAQGAWPDAVEALEAFVASSREPAQRIAALLLLADVYERRLGRAADAERVLRAAVEVDPTNLAALRRLLEQRRGNGGSADEIASLLGRLSQLEREPVAKASVLVDLADAQLARGDTAKAETALVEALAQAPNAARLARLLALSPSGPVDQRRMLRAVVARGQELERLDPTILATLGQIEISLGLFEDAATHLRLAVALQPSSHETRLALAEALTRNRGGSEPAALIESMIASDAGPLLSLREPARAVATLEVALANAGQPERSLVARELRAIAGGLDDGAHVELRTRRVAFDAAPRTPGALDATTLLESVVPQDTQRLLFDLVAALAGAEEKLVRVTVEELGVGPRDRLSPAGGHPLLMLVHQLSATLGIARPEVAVSSTLPLPRLVLKDPPWLVVPSVMMDQPDPVLVAALVGPLVRIALSVTWLEDLPGPYAHAVLCGAARQAVPGFSALGCSAEQQDLVDELAQRVARAVGRRQKKALGALAPALAALPGLTLADGAAFERAVHRAELRTAFVLTGHLLATVDVARARDAELGRTTQNVGLAALRAVLGHPIAGDVVRFALGPTAMALRQRAGTLRAPTT
jgi:tetratricopeptide (TPR) repeat protein/tRNA A-37 threonylcarbamoyl transferase component Bud32